MVLVKEEMGKDWLTHERFRIGASSLLQDICSEIIKTFEEVNDQSASEEKISKGEEKKDEERKKK